MLGTEDEEAAEATACDKDEANQVCEKTAGSGQCFFRPQCVYTPPYTFGMVMRAYDAFGAFAVSRTSVRVEPTPEMPQTEFVDKGSDMLQISIDSGNLAGVLSIADTMAKKLNSEGDSRRRLAQHGEDATVHGRMLQTDSLVELRSGMMETVSSAFSASPVTVTACAAFANTVSSTVGEPFEMSIDSTQFATTFSGNTLLDDCAELGFAYGSTTGSSLVTAYSYLMEARDMTGTAAQQRKVYDITDTINAAVYKVSDTLLAEKEMNEDESVVATENILLVSQKLGTERLGNALFKLPQTGGHAGQTEASFSLPSDVASTVTADAVNTQMLWWSKDPAVESPLSSTRLSSVLEFSVISVPEPEAPTGRRSLGESEPARVRRPAGSGESTAISAGGAGIGRRDGGYGQRGRRRLQTHIPIETSSCINISIPMQAADYALSPNYLATCVSWDEAATDWTTDGCYIKEASSDQARCCCNHLSTFGVLLENSVTVMQPEPSVLSGYITSLLDGSRPEPLFALTIVLLVYFLAVAWGHARDQKFKEARKEEEFKIKETKNLFSAYKKHLEAKHGGADLDGNITPEHMKHKSKERKARQQAQIANIIRDAIVRPIAFQPSVYVARCDCHADLAVAAYSRKTRLGAIASKKSSSRSTRTAPAIWTTRSSRLR